jgi:hypothetical protein
LARFVNPPVGGGGITFVVACSSSVEILIVIKRGGYHSGKAPPSLSIRQLLCILCSGDDRTKTETERKGV